jgi:cytoskeletal protein CcmA (bactofilin family)
MADAGAGQEFPTILGPDANFKGELSFEKGMRLMGRFEGKMSTPGRVHIAKEAKMSADVDAGAIIIEGEVQGNLSANDRIELKQTARYEGDLRASKLVVDEAATRTRRRRSAAAGSSGTSSTPAATRKMTPAA